MHTHVMSISFGDMINDALTAVLVPTIIGVTVVINRYHIWFFTTDAEITGTTGAVPTAICLRKSHTQGQQSSQQEY